MKRKIISNNRRLVSLYTQLLGLEEAIENIAACVLHTSIVVQAMQSTISPAGCLKSRILSYARKKNLK